VRTGVVVLLDRGRQAAVEGGDLGADAPRLRLQPGDAFGLVAEGELARRGRGTRRAQERATR